jgi:hypothetical protein
LNDYSKLADKLKGVGSANGRAKEPSAKRAIDLTAIYECLILHVDTEVEKANKELIKRKLPTLEHIFLPSYRGTLCLTFGSELLCKVDLHEAKGQIIAIITGPPNGHEISRKEFPPLNTAPDT